MITFYNYVDRHRSRKRRPFSRYAARRRMNSVHREKSMLGYHGDSKFLEEKLEVVGDLKTQIRGLINDNEDVKLNQEELNANMASVTQQLALVAEALDRMSSPNNNSGRTEIFRRVSRASRQSFRKQLSSFTPKPSPQISTNGAPQSAPVIPSSSNKTLLAASPSVSVNSTPKVLRKVSLEKAVKQLTDLAVTISADDKKSKTKEVRTKDDSSHISKGNECL